MQPGKSEGSRDVNQLTVGTLHGHIEFLMFSPQIKFENGFHG